METPSANATRRVKIEVNKPISRGFDLPASPSATPRKLTHDVYHNSSPHESAAANVCAWERMLTAQDIADIKKDCSQIRIPEI
jgi:hypothetical protein